MSTAVAPAATASVVAPIVAPIVDEPLDMDGVLTRVTERIDVLRRELVLLAGDMKVLRRVAKQKDRGGNKRKKPTPDADRRPSGFARPSELSDELCDFLRVERGTALARTMVTRMICKHIKDNALNDETNKRCIDFGKPMAADLKALLRPEPGAVVTFFNLQRYLKQHIRRVEGTTAPTTSPVTTTTNTVSATPASITTAEVEGVREGARDAARKRTKREA
jgi:chromatin remodeling complex protein RSC6